jgi:hypothetical protein
MGGKVNVIKRDGLKKWAKKLHVRFTERDGKGQPR